MTDNNFDLFPKGDPNQLNTPVSKPCLFQHRLGGENLHPRIYIATKMIIVLCKENQDFKERLFSQESYQTGAADKFHATINWLEKQWKSGHINEPASKDASNGNTLAF